MSVRSPKVQACDGCRTRKVRCNGRQPCPQCEHFNLHCTFSPKKARTHGRRGRLVAQLRGGGGSDRRETKPGPTSPSPPLRPLARGSDDGREEETSPRGQHAGPGEEDHVHVPSPRAPPPPPPAHASYTAEYFLALIPDFENYTYPVNPIITPEQIRTSIGLMPVDATHAALVYSFAAVTINLTMTQQQHTHKQGIDLISSNSNSSSEPGIPVTTSDRIHDLMNHCLRARGRAAPTDALSDSRLSGGGGGGGLAEIQIATCIFLEICWMAFKRPEQAFLALRDAIALIQLLRVDRGQGALTGPEYARRQRIYWEAYIHERFLTMTNCFPSVMRPLGDYHQGAAAAAAAVDHSIPPNIDAGFRRLIKLFLILDDDLLASWVAQNDSGGGGGGGGGGVVVTAGWVELKQQQLDDDEAEAEAEQRRLRGSAAALTELQLADLLVTRAWMQTVVWQLAVSGFLLSSGPAGAGGRGRGRGSLHGEALSLFFPARRLPAQLRRLARFRAVEASVGGHGSGILQKMFEIANTVADVMALLPVAASAAGPGGFDQAQAQDQARQCMSDLLLLVRVLLSFERVDKTQRDIILSKVEALKAIFPGLDFDLVSLPVWQVRREGYTT